MALEPSTINTVSLAWAMRQQQRQQSSIPEIWNLLDAVTDPEIPVLSLWDLGVLRDIEQGEDGKVLVTMTPTYSGCPALEVMEDMIADTLQAHGYNNYNIRSQLAPAWTTDWLSPQGRKKLQDYGIAAPRGDCAMTPETGITCPHCGDTDTQRVSEFGSTACKALFQCQVCHEPFDYFKKL